MFNKLAHSADSFANGNLAIITFNYDRVIEHFLYTALANSYALQPDQCSALMQHVPIIHLHGKLGSLPWQNEDGPRIYNPQLSSETLRIHYNSFWDVEERAFGLASGKALGVHVSRLVIDDKHEALRKVLKQNLPTFDNVLGLFRAGPIPA